MGMGEEANQEMRSFCGFLQSSHQHPSPVCCSQQLSLWFFLPKNKMAVIVMSSQCGERGTQCCGMTRQALGAPKRLPVGKRTPFLRARSCFSERNFLIALIRGNVQWLPFNMCLWRTGIHRSRIFSAESFLTRGSSTRARPGHFLTDTLIFLTLASLGPCSILFSEILYHLVQSIVWIRPHD